MISQATIEAVYHSIDLVELIGRFVPLKKSGSSWQGKSPFSNEKTPSFYVVPSKNLWKDFSSGKGGNGIHFLMESQGFTYPQAIEWAAKHYKITIEYDQQTPEQKEQATTRDLIRKINAATNKYYVEKARTLSHPEPVEGSKGAEALEAQLNRFDEATRLEWQIGYTGADPKFIYQLAAEKGLVKDAEAAGVVVLRQGNYYDFFQNRIMYPIHNLHGEIVGFGGRALGDEKPKYLNTAENVLFHKSWILYGLYQGQKTIRDEGEVFLVEGYTDVIAMHEMNLCNAVATLGTALSEDHLKTLARMVRTVIILRDGDKAGTKAAIRDMELILKAGLRAEMVILPEGEDPYSFSHSMTEENPAEWIQENRKDALLHWVEEAWKNTGTNPNAKGEAMRQVGEWLALIENPIVRETYRKLIGKLTKIKEKDIKEIEGEFTIKLEKAGYDLKPRMFDLPDGVTEEEVLRHGFYGKVERTRENNRTGYYFMTSGSGTFQQVSNFVITPLFHKYELEDNTRVIRIANGVVPDEIVEMPSSALISVEKFRNFLFDKGPYFFDGARVHLDKLNKRYLFEFPKAFELKTLGWQNEGFFAFYNCVYSGEKIVQYDDSGLVKHGDHFFFSPAASNIYSDIRKDDDLFENDRYMKYVKSPISFDEWMRLMHEVYGEHAMAAIPFVFVALFRDIVFKVDNNCPFLYFYGQSKSGKSKCAESVMSFFTVQMPAFQLNGGTDFAFASRLQRFRNIPVFLNEFDDNVVKDEWFQMIKGAYDGEGRERGRGGSKRKTEIQKVNAALLLCGQYLSTKDDNSVLSRAILRTFKITYDRSDKQVKAYNELKEFEKAGITSLGTELLQYREKVKSEYYARFYEVFKDISTIIRGRRQQYEERVLRNYTALFTMYDIFRAWYTFPWKYDEYKEWIIGQIIHMSGLISESDILVDFWTFVSSLVDHREVVNGRDFKIVYKSEIRITKGKGDIQVPLPETKKVLYIRLREVWVVYAGAKKKSGGNPIDFTSLKTYMENRDYYLGYVHRERIGNKSVDCYALDYDAVGINIETEDEVPGTKTIDTPPPPLGEDLPF